MTIDWALFTPAILLLLFPADKLFSAQIELRSFDCLVGLRARDRRRSLWWMAPLWLDPLRGFLGAWLLVRALELNVRTWMLTPKIGFAVSIGVLILAALSQTFTRRDHGVVLAPIGFIAGVVIALVPGFAPVFGVILAMVAMFGFRQFYAFFAVGVVVMPVLGFVFEATPGLVGAASLMFLVPLLVGMLSNSLLEVPWHRGGNP